jgi:peptide-methionine (S)-S-oxide reductase
VPSTTPSARHTVLGTPLRGPYPDGALVAVFGMGCFWGAERLFWRLDGVFCTAVGYAGGHKANPSYEDVCRGYSGHAEVVQVVYDPTTITYADLLKVFWENHDPTQGDRQGPDLGPHYRSTIYATTAAQLAEAQASRDAFAEVVRAAGMGAITTEIGMLDTFWYADDSHQQYLSDAKNPNGYCNHGPNGLSCPVGVARVPSELH